MILELDDGTQLDVVEAEEEDAFSKKRTASIFIRRSVLNNATITFGRTEAYLLESSSQSPGNALFAGIIRDVDRSGGIAELMMTSFERLAVDAQPTPPDEVYGPRVDNPSEGAADSDIVADAINDVPTLSIGTLDTVANPLSITFNNATQAKKIREVANITGALVRYNEDKTVDYIGDPTTDRGITLSPGNQNLSGNFSAERINGSEEDVTHLRVIGTGEGESQLVRNIVPDADSASYDNEVRYTNPDWSDGDKKSWFVQSNKDIDRTNALEEYGLALIDDISGSEYIDVNATVEDVSSVDIGDVFTVTYDEKNIDALDMEIVEYKTVYGPSARKHEVTLSTRRIARSESGEDDRKDIQRFNQASLGQSVAINATGGRQPVNSGTNYQMRAYYPSEVIDETRINVRVMGLPYRAYSQGAGAGAQTIKNEVPFDEGTASGFDGTLRTNMRYPNVGDVELDFVVYEEGGDTKSVEPYEIENTGNESNSIVHEETASGLVVDVRTSGATPEGQPVTTAEGSWVQSSKYDAGDFSEISVKWSWESSDGSGSTAIAGLAHDPDSAQPLASADESLVYSTDSASGFTRRTDSLSLSGYEDYRRVRVHSRVESTSTNVSAKSDVDIHRIEYLE